MIEILLNFALSIRFSTLFDVEKNIFSSQHQIYNYVITNKCPKWAKSVTI